MRIEFDIPEYAAEELSRCVEVMEQMPDPTTRTGEAFRNEHLSNLRQAAGEILLSGFLGQYSDDADQIPPYVTGMLLPYSNYTIPALDTVND